MDRFARWVSWVAVVMLAGCSATTTSRPVAPMPLPIVAATAGSPAAAFAMALAVAPEQPSCLPFAGESGDQLCLLAVPDQEAGSVTYTVGLARVRGGQWVVTAQINDSLGMKPEMYPVGEATASAALGEVVALSATERAIELVLEGTWRYDEEGGQSRREEIRILYWQTGDDLVEVLNVRSSGDSSADLSEMVTQTYEVLGSGEGALFDVEVTTHSVRDSWPDDRHTDETETVRYAWNGAAYVLAAEQPEGEGEVLRRAQDARADEEGEGEVLRRAQDAREEEP